MNQENSTMHNRLSQRSMWLKIVGLILIVLSFGIFIFYTYHQGEKIQEQEIKIVKADSIISVIKDSTVNVVSRRDSIASIVKLYIESWNNHDIESIEYMHNDTLIKYYKDIRKKTRQEISTVIKNSWKDDPRAKLSIIDSVDVVDNKKNAKGIVKVLFVGTNHKEEKLLLFFGFTEANKINLIRAYSMEK